MRIIAALRLLRLLSWLLLLLLLCALQSVNCLTAKLYQKEQYIDERHRHRCGA
jgi:hypothetical protein